MATTPEHDIARMVVLAAVAKAATYAARGGAWWGADVSWVADKIGRTRPDLLNSKRERLLTELRRDGLIAFRRTHAGSGWSLTEAGKAVLEVAH